MIVNVPVAPTPMFVFCVLAAVKMYLESEPTKVTVFVEATTPLTVTVIVAAPVRPSAKT